LFDPNRTQLEPKSKSKLTPITVYPSGTLIFRLIVNYCFDHFVLLPTFEWFSFFIGSVLIRLFSVCWQENHFSNRKFALCNCLSKCCQLPERKCGFQIQIHFQRQLQSLWFRCWCPSTTTRIIAAFGKWFMWHFKYVHHDSRLVITWPVIGLDEQTLIWK